MNEFFTDTDAEHDSASRSQPRHSNAILAGGLGQEQIVEAIQRLTRMTDPEKLRRAAEARRAFERDRVSFFRHAHRLVCIMLDRVGVTDARCRKLSSKERRFAARLPDHRWVSLGTGSRS